MPNKKSSATTASRRVLPGEFCHHFLEQSRSLYLLALMLTTDQELAEQCFTKAFDDCLNATGVSRGWERTWARRSVICNAIELTGDTWQQPSQSSSRELTRGVGRFSDQDPRLAGVMALSPFERFVFVLSVLESYSDQECRVLLKCTKQEIIDSRLRALQALGESAKGEPEKNQIGQPRTQYSSIEIGSIDQRFTKITETLSPGQR